jgi:hypothetical protein
MAISSTGAYSFQRTSSAWEVHESWRARRREAAANYLAQGSAAMSAFATAATNQIDGMASLTTQAAVTRLQKQLSAKSQSLNLTA